MNIAIGDLEVVATDDHHPVDLGHCLPRCAGHLHPGLDGRRHGQRRTPRRPGQGRGRHGTPGQGRRPGLRQDRHADHGPPTVTAVHALEYDDDALLELASHLEQASEHQLGRTVVDEAIRRGLTVGQAPDQVDVVAGGGITGVIDGRTLAIGSPAMAGRMTAEGGTGTLAGLEDYITGQQREGNTAVVLVDSVLAGVISIADRIRPEARNAIAAPRKAGISEFHMFTGDNRHTAELVSSQLGIDHVRADLLPQDKVKAVTELKGRGLRVGMIVDGTNDAPAIATADIGLAMGAGTDVSIQTADIILTSNRFDRLGHAYRLSKATMRNMRQNTVVAIGTVVLLVAGVLAHKVVHGHQDARA